jgi:hypothetical protein
MATYVPGPTRVNRFAARRGQTVEILAEVQFLETPFDKTHIVQPFERGPFIRV